MNYRVLTVWLLLRYLTVSSLPLVEFCDKAEKLLWFVPFSKASLDGDPRHMPVPMHWPEDVDFPEE